VSLWLAGSFVGWLNRRLLPLLIEHTIERKNSFQSTVFLRYFAIQLAKLYATGMELQ